MRNQTNQMGVINTIYHSVFIQVKLSSFYLLFLTLTLVSCNPPYHHERGAGGARRYRDQNRCHELQQEVQNLQKPNLNSDGQKAIDLTPGIILIQNDTEVRGGDITIQIVPPKEPEVTKVAPSNADSCPEGSGIHKPSGKCFRFSRHSEVPLESPCGSFMEFYKEPSDSKYGDCDCKLEVGGVVRPIVYWEQTDKCYWLFDQGPCKTGEWLIMNEKNLPSCFKRSCPENLPADWNTIPKETGKKKFWFRHRGKCYQTGTQAYCEDPSHKIFYETNKETGYALRCKDFAINVKALLNGVKEIPCAPGHKKAISGACSRIISFE